MAIASAINWMKLALGLIATAALLATPGTSLPCVAPEFTDYISKAYQSTFVVEGSLLDKRPRGNKRTTLHLEVSPIQFYKWPAELMTPLATGGAAKLRLQLDLGRSSVSAAESTGCSTDVWEKRKQLRKGQTYLFYVNASAAATANVRQANQAPALKLLATFFPDHLNHSMRARLRKLTCNSTNDCNSWSRRLTPNIKKLSHSVHYQRVELHCNVSSMGEVKINWMKDDAKLHRSRVHSFAMNNERRQSVLTIITSAATAAEGAAVHGRYICEARSVAGSRRSASFIVNDQLVAQSMRRPAIKMTLVPTVVAHVTATLTVERTEQSTTNATTTTGSTTTVSYIQTTTPITCSSRNVTFLKCRNGQCLIALNNAPYCKCEDRYTGLRCDRLSRPASSSRSRAMREANTKSKSKRRSRSRKIRPSISAKRGRLAESASDEKLTYISMFNRALQAARKSTATLTPIPTPTPTLLDLELELDRLISTEQSYSYMPPVSETATATAKAMETEQGHLITT